MVDRCCKKKQKKLRVYVQVTTKVQCRLHDYLVLHVLCIQVDLPIYLYFQDTPFLWIKEIGVV